MTAAMTAVAARRSALAEGTYTETSGAIGGVMLLLLWFYISGLVMLLGAERNAEE